ncbi:MAG: T9SS type A sorting domain-containing protein, partial [Cyclonatronaceae bacterium]
VQAAGMMYKFRNHPADSVLINRNTFVNAAGQLFTSFGYESNMTITHNLIVNSNVQAYFPGLDYAETDQDYLPHGIVNLNHLPDGSEIADDERKVLVAYNGVYWDDRLDNIVETLRSENVPCPDTEGPSDCQEGGEWVSQMITMNSRTQEMFDDNSRYPFLNEGNWVMGGDPQFTDHGGLMTDAVDEVVQWGIDAAGPGNDQLMGKWRTPGNEAVTGEVENFLNFDWPVAADLSYSNSEFLNTDGLGGFAIGDLNWFPDQKADWEAQREEEYALLGEALNSGEFPTSFDTPSANVPTTIELKQNYPNPFNPSTQIEYTLAEPANITIEVYDTAGQRVATLVNDSFQQSGTHNVRFDASSLSSGVYFYRLSAGSQQLTGKMTLIK